MVEFVYSDADKNSLHYKLGRMVAERERQNRFGPKFSERYFQSFELDKTGSGQAMTNMPPEFARFFSTLTKTGTITSIATSVIFLVVGVALLFIRGENDRIVGAMFVGGSVLSVVSGMVMSRFRRKRRMFSGPSRTIPDHKE